MPTAAQFRAHRRARKLTQLQVAAELGVTRETVSEWERGRRAIPHMVKFWMGGGGK